MKIQFSAFALFFAVDEMSQIDIGEDSITVTTTTGVQKIIRIHKSHVQRMDPQVIGKEASTVQRVHISDSTSPKSRMDMNQQPSNSVPTVEGKKLDIPEAIKKFEMDIWNLERKFVSETENGWCISQAPDFVSEFASLREKNESNPEFIEKLDEETQSLLEWMGNQALKIGEEITRIDRERGVTVHNKNKKKKPRKRNSFKN